jgi:hypothetical protein
MGYGICFKTKFKGFFVDRHLRVTTNPCKGYHMKFIISFVVLAFLASSTSAFAWGAKSKSSGYKAKSSSGSYKAKAYAPKKTHAPKKSYKK